MYILVSAAKIQDAGIAHIFVSQSVSVSFKTCACLQSCWFYSKTKNIVRQLMLKLQLNEQISLTLKGLELFVIYSRTRFGISVLWFITAHKGSQSLNLSQAYLTSILMHAQE